MDKVGWLFISDQYKMLAEFCFLFIFFNTGKNKYVMLQACSVTEYFETLNRSQNES